MQYFTVGSNRFLDVWYVCGGTKTIFVVMLDSLNWRTFHASHRSLNFILSSLISNARPTIFHGGSTLRINVYVFEIHVHKYDAKCHFFVSHGSIWIYCLVMTSIRMFYEKLLRNSTTRMS